MYYKYIYPYLHICGCIDIYICTGLGLHRHMHVMQLVDIEARMSFNLAKVLVTSTWYQVLLGIK